MSSEIRHPAASARLDVGRVVSRTLLVFRRQAGPLAVVAASTVGLTTVLFGALRLSGVIADPGDTTTAIAGAPGENLAEGLASYLLAGAAVRSTMAGLRGGGEPLRSLFRSGARHFVRVLAISLLASLAIFAGLILFIVPGLVLWARWCAAVPASVVENKLTGQAMKRSAQLTANHRGAIILLGLIGLIGYVLFAVLLTVVMTAVGLLGVALRAYSLELIVTQLIMLPLLTVSLALLSYVGKTVIYAELSGATDRGPAEDLLEVFA